MVFSSYMCCWRVFIISLRYTLLLATLALGFTAAYATSNEAVTNSSTAVTFLAEPSSPNIATITADELYSSINAISSYQLLDEGQLDNKDLHSPPVFHSYWQQFVISLPPFERLAVSIFNCPSQLEPLFVIAYEFLPEIRARKYFLTLVPPNNNLPWYLRATSSNKHNRVTGWKDGNNLYTGSITYLS